ncbi:hypothetical protein LshimejAT787_0505710 [Lyophyllum shimeji]|uniref:Uncharacterized protein n=1 Tax=Lyophyllum shimeji TaxID=47721 RepID=A0A9P3PN53_LYOSH|nr:hypothetical protein LshimejAT787_0505710 [Lyophyllum shimeji]
MYIFQRPRNSLVSLSRGLHYSDNGYFEILSNYPLAAGEVRFYLEAFDTYCEAYVDCIMTSFLLPPGHCAVSSIKKVEAI